MFLLCSLIYPCKFIQKYYLLQTYSKTGVFCCWSGTIAFRVRGEIEVKAEFGKKVPDTLGENFLKHEMLVKAQNAKNNEGMK